MTSRRHHHARRRASARTSATRTDVIGLMVAPPQGRSVWRRLGRQGVWRSGGPRPRGTGACVASEAERRRRRDLERTRGRAAAVARGIPREPQEDGERAPRRGAPRGAVGELRRRALASREARGAHPYGQPLDVLLDDEGREGCDRKRPGGGRAKASGKPRERDSSRQRARAGSAVRDRGMSGASPRRVGEPVRKSVANQDAGRHERRDGEPHSRAVHAPIIRAARAGGGYGSVTVRAFARAEPNGRRTRGSEQAHARTTRRIASRSPAQPSAYPRWKARSASSVPSRDARWSHGKASRHRPARASAQPSASSP